ncbi:CP family cyanate transporter-like MFS transporter [Sporosarcina luteola]|nr:CP family cyanate transporter-like MFS transporter [Sporosarcina luteola]
MEKEHTIYISKKLTFQRSSWLLIVGIIFIAATLRAPLTSVGPIIAPLRDDLGIPNSVAGFVTTIPLLAFALISPLVPKVSSRFGMEATLFISLCLLTIGIFLRSAGTIPFLFFGTFLIGVAISFGNVLLPAILKLSFPLHIGLMTGIYSVSMNISATLASGLSVPILEKTAYGWQGALGVWAVLTGLAILIWLPQLRQSKDNRASIPKTSAKRPASLWRSPIAWGVTLFMGLQSLLFYTTSAWLPEVLKSQGLDASQAGWMLSLLQIAQLPMTFIIPIIASKLKDQRLIVAIIVLLYLIGYGGILLDGTRFVPLWMVITGIAGGASFGLAMMFFTLRTNTPMEAAELSGMAQSIGYLLAAIGPVLFGILHDVTGSWDVSLIVLLVASFIVLLSGLKAGKNGYVQGKGQH